MRDTSVSDAVDEPSDTSYVEPTHDGSSAGSIARRTSAALASSRRPAPTTDDDEPDPRPQKQVRTSAGGQPSTQPRKAASAATKTTAAQSRTAATATKRATRSTPAVPAEASTPAATRSKRVSPTGRPSRPKASTSTTEAARRVSEPPGHDDSSEDRGPKVLVIRLPRMPWRARTRSASRATGDRAAAPTRVTRMSRARNVVLISAVAIVLIAMAVTDLVLNSKVSNRDDIAAARTAAISQARTSIPSVASSSYKTYDADSARALKQSTGAFTKTLASKQAQLRSSILSKKAITKVTFTDAAVTGASADSVELLVFVSQTSAVGTASPQVGPAALMVTMKKVSGTWLVSALALV